QAVRHLDDINAVKEGLVVLVVAEGLPFGFVRVRQDDAVERNSGKTLGALEVAFLRGRQQGMQHLDGRLEHLDKFQQPLVGQAQAARVAIGVGVVLRVAVQLADVDLSNQRRDVLVVFVARLGLGDAYLPQYRRIQADRHRQDRSEEHTSELQSRENLVCRLLLEKKKKKITKYRNAAQSKSL